MKIRGILLLTFFFLLSGYCYGEPLRLVTLQYPPYEFEEQGEVKGIAVEIVEEAFRRMQQPIRIELLPWAKALKQVKNGKADAVFTAFKTQEREKFADYSREILINQTVSLFVRKDSKVIFDGDLEKLGRYKFGVVQNISYGKIFDDAVRNGYIQPIDVAETGQMNMQRLMEGRFDILISNRYGAFYILKKLDKLDRVKELTPAMESVPSYIAFTKKKDLVPVRNTFDSTLREMMNDGTYEKILRSYLP
jgi:polar amino acid transport system substrate-binding protein